MSSASNVLLIWCTATVSSTVRIIGVMHRLKYIYPRHILFRLYNTLIIPHFTYSILVWGSKIVPNHSIHLLQKKALRIVTNKEYIAHSEPLCKELHVVSVPDMFCLSLWKFYFKLMNNKLPQFFNIMLPVQPLICQTHDIRKPKLHLPAIKHEFAEQLLQFQIVKLLNKEQSSLITSKVHSHSFHGFKIYLKNSFINSYSDHCIIVNCNACAELVRRQNT